MKRIRHGLLFLLALIMILQACSGQKTVEDGQITVDDTPAAVPLLEDIQLITVLDRDDNVIIEHRELSVIQELLQGMKDAQPSYIEDPEPGGDLYQLVISGNGESRTFSINDLSQTNGLHGNVNVKLYATLPGEENVKAWTLDIPWIQRLLNPNVNEAAPEILVTIDEHSDRVILVANRDIDQPSLSEAIQTTLSLTTEYKMHWTGFRRVAIEFPNLAQEAAVEFILEGTKTVEGERYHIRTPQDSKVITIRQGIAWSGLRWVETTGRTVHQHGFDSAVIIQPSTNDGEILIYNYDNLTYLFHPENRDIADITLREWTDHEDKYRSDSGVSVLYSYPAEKDVRYIAKGLETIYCEDMTGGTPQLIYESDRPIYGMASSPDGGHIAILVDSELNLGPSADLLVIDALGRVVSEFTKAAYVGHSDGWHFSYPVTWIDDETIAVPLIGSSGEAFLRGKALFHYKKGLLSKEENPALPEDAVTLLQSAINDLDISEIIRVLPKPHDVKSRYYAVFVAGLGSYLIDREGKDVTRLGSGPLVTWTSAGQIVVWHSTEGKSVQFVGIG